MKILITGAAGFIGFQPGDVEETCADIGDLMRDAGFRPVPRLLRLLKP